jgi:hypothetical protein
MNKVRRKVPSQCKSKHESCESGGGLSNHTCLGDEAKRGARRRPSFPWHSLILSHRIHSDIVSQLRAFLIVDIDAVLLAKLKSEAADQLELFLLARVRAS